MSISMIDQARSRNAGPGIEFQVADAHALPFLPRSFDAARIERPLQHVESPAAVLIPAWGCVHVASSEIPTDHWFVANT